MAKAKNRLARPQVFGLNQIDILLEGEKIDKKITIKNRVFDAWPQQIFVSNQTYDLKQIIKASKSNKEVGFYKPSAQEK